MKIMYIFPHPDDESFGPAGAINKQIEEGNEVILLTLTKGGVGGLAKVNPILLEKELTKWIEKYNPTIVITYPVHGGSGHHDHIALHHSIKHLFYHKPNALSSWKRLAYFTVIDTGLPMFLEGGIPRVTQTKQEDVAVTVQLSESNITAMKKALLCYDTYQEMVKTTNVIDRIGSYTHFELENEKHSKVLSSITELITI
jgi:LmbE family N-acetylglucosaminyl deacetylase